MTSDRSVRTAEPTPFHHCVAKDSRFVVLPALAALATIIASCTPTVQVDAPKEPITINLNIKLDADVRLRIEEKAKEDVGTKPIF